MDAETAKNFYDNYEWFSELLDDLVTLLDERIEKGLRDKLGYDGESWSGYPSRKYRPTMPDFYRRGIEGKNLPSIQITALLRQDWDNRDVPTGEPMLMVVMHDFAENNFGITQNILDYSNLTKFELGKDDASFGGVLDWGKPVEFHGFFVPLDAFSQQSCTDVDATVREKVVEPLKAIREKHFTKPRK